MKGVTLDTFVNIKLFSSALCDLVFVTSIKKLD